MDDLTRLALFEEWGEHCVWCKVPLFFDVMEVEHLLPKSLAGEKRRSALADHGLPDDFDLESLENLAPSCARCNGGKGSKPPPNAPIVALVLATAAEKAPAVRISAERSRENRRISRAIPIVLEGARAGNEKAIAALREAAAELAEEFSRSSGRTVARLSSALTMRAGGGLKLGGSDLFFSYPEAKHETAEAGPPPTPGSVMSISEASGDLTNRVDVVPRSDEAMELYGPRFRLIPTDGPEGPRASEALRAALQEGRGVEIAEGLDLVFDQLPPALQDLVGERLTGGSVILGDPEKPPRRPIPDWDAKLRVTGPGGTQSIRLRLTQSEEVPQGWDDAVSGEIAGLTVTGLMRRVGDSGQFRWNFRRKSSLAPASQQLHVLRFLASVAHGGELRIRDVGKTKRPDLTLAVDEQPHLEAARAAVKLFEIATDIEAWTGQSLRFGESVDPDEVRVILEVGRTIRDKGISGKWTEASFVVGEGAIKQLRSASVVRVEQTVLTEIGDQTVTLGSLETVLTDFEVIAAAPYTDEPGRFEVKLAPRDPDKATLFQPLRRPRGAGRPSPKPTRRKRKRRGRKRR